MEIMAKKEIKNEEPIEKQFCKAADKMRKNIQEIMSRLTGIDLSLCPQSGTGKMVFIETLPIVLRNLLPWEESSAV